MKTKVKFLVCALLMLAWCLFISACNATKSEQGLWENAIYTVDTEFGSGAKVVMVEVRADEKAVTFTINSDKETLGDALLEHSLISGEKGPYGLYVKTVNGITADYNINQSYWSLSKEGGYMQTGVDGTQISDGEHYELTYTK